METMHHIRLDQSDGLVSDRLPQLDTRTVGHLHVSNSVADVVQFVPQDMRHRTAPLLYLTMRDMRHRTAPNLHVTMRVMAKLGLSRLHAVQLLRPSFVMISNFMRTRCRTVTRTLQS